LLRTAKLFSSGGKISNMVAPETNAVVPKGTSSSSEVPSSYLTIWCFPSRDLHRVKGGDLGRREVVQGSVDVPSVETGVTFGSVLWGNLGLVETRVLRVLQLGFSETFVVVDSTVSDQLNLRDSRDRLEVWVKDRL
jgi:hypothetical protein